MQRDQAFLSHITDKEAYQTLPDNRTADDPKMRLWIARYDRTPKLPKIDAAERWRGLIQQYSQRQLSFSSDTLPALSGLAQRWASRHPDLGAYVAGLWEDDVPQGLLWCRIIAGNAAHLRAPDNHAPSWSWAAAKGEIEHIGPKETNRLYRVKFIRATCVVPGANRFGEASSGQLVLRGQLRSATLEVQGDMASGQAFLRSGDRKLQYFRHDRDEECQMLHGTEVYMIWYCTDLRDLDKQTGFERVLVLHRQSEGVNTFSRLGVVEYFQDVDAVFDVDNLDSQRVELTII